MAQQIKPICIFEPLPWQLPAWQYQGRVQLLTGSSGGGKSKLLYEKAHGFCLNYPGSTALLVRKTRNSMTNSTVIFLKRNIIGKDKRVRHYPSKMRFEYDNGSILAYGGMADKEQREQIRSIGQAGSVEWIGMEEATAFIEDDFNELLVRLRGTAASWRQICLATNPDSDQHWIKKRLIDKGEAKIFLSKAVDNKYNPDDYIESLQSLTGVLYDRLILGKWVRAEGVVYDDFDRSAHVIDTVPWERLKRYIAGVDWGYHPSPGVMQIWGLDGDERMYLVKEFYHTGKLLDWWIYQAKKMNKKYRIDVFACDPSEPEHIEKFRRAGLNAVKGKNAKMPGIQAVKSRYVIQGDRLPRLFYYVNALDSVDPELDKNNRPLSTVAEKSIWSWAKDGMGNMKNDEPEKKNDHGQDAERYAVMVLDNYVPVNIGRFGVEVDSGDNSTPVSQESIIEGRGTSVSIAGDMGWD